MMYDSCEKIASKPMHINVAMSFVSIENARANLVLQSHQTSLNEAERVWTDLLSRVAVDETSSGGSTTDTASSVLLTKFVTSVYHTYLAPSMYEDSNGEYMSFSSDSKVNKVGEGLSDRRRHAYTDMSIWDIHRTQLPWLSLTVPDVYTDVLASLQFMSMEGSGDIPRWPLLNIYTGCMIGSHAWVSFAEAVAKNQSEELDMPYVFKSMVAGATTERTHGGRIGVRNYTTLGYVPSELDKQSASLTLSYAFDDAAVATVAKFLNKNGVAEIFHNRSLAAFKHLWSEQRLLLCPKSFQTGQTNCPLDEALPYPFETTYVEGDALQWLWFVPHDPGGLVALFPSSKDYVARLESFMHKSLSPKEGGDWIGGTVLANAWYW
jgi:putative alpha-1,2-mannosidase